MKRIIFLFIAVYFPSQMSGQEVYLPEQLNQRFIEEKESQDCEPLPICLPTILTQEDREPDGVLPPRPWFPRPTPEEPEIENPREDPFAPEKPKEGKDPKPEKPPETPEKPPELPEDLPENATWLDRVGDNLSKWFEGIFDGSVLRTLKQMISLVIWTVPVAIVISIFLFFGDVILYRTASIIRRVRDLTDSWKYFWKKEDE